MGESGIFIYKNTLREIVAPFQFNVSCKHSRTVTKFLPVRIKQGACI